MKFILVNALKFTKRFTHIVKKSACLVYIYVHIYTAGHQNYNTMKERKYKEVRKWYGLKTKCLNM